MREFGDSLEGIARRSTAAVVCRSDGATQGGEVLLDALPLIASALSRPLILTFPGDGRARFEWTRRADALSQRNPAVRVEFTDGWIPRCWLHCSMRPISGRAKPMAGAL